MKDKFILDACCGPRMFWDNKKHPNCIYQDIRDEDKGLVDNRQNREIKPDIVGDFTNMKHFKDKSFKLVIWDPPHIIQKYNKKCRMIATYGCLEPETWQDTLKKGFNECWRVLDDYGILIFKWSEVDRWGQKKFSAKLEHILKLFHTRPLVSQKVKWTKDNQFATFWCCFMKIPEELTQKVTSEEKGEGDILGVEGKYPFTKEQMDNAFTKKVKEVQGK